MIYRYVIFAAVAIPLGLVACSPGDEQGTGGGSTSSTSTGAPVDAGHDAPADASPLACITTADCAAWGAEHCTAPYVGVCNGGTGPDATATCGCNDWTSCLAPSTCSTYGAPCCYFFETDAGKSACSGKCYGGSTCMPSADCPVLSM